MYADSVKFIEAPAFTRYPITWVTTNTGRSRNSSDGVGHGGFDARDGRIPKNTLGGQEAR
jgi:hypothetical protein